MTGITPVSARRITVITTGHLSTCPRMLKAADALSEAGHDVRVVSVLALPWAVEADLALAPSRPWAWTPVDLRREVRPLTSVAAALRLKAARRLARVVGPERLSLRAATAALTRGAAELTAAAASRPTDLVYAGTVGGLGVGWLAATRLRAPCALDLEDLYADDAAPDPAGELDDRLIRRLERHVLPRARFLTAGSAGIAEEYHRRSGCPVIPLHNVLPRPSEPTPLAAGAGPRRLLWFSQTIGPGRGIEDVVRALGLLGRPATLTLQGHARGPYLEQVRGLAGAVAPRLEVRHAPPVSPERLLEQVRTHEIGLALEPRSSANKDLCLSNKALTYVTAGLAVVLSDTTGQRALAHDLGPAAVLYPPGEPAELARVLEPWLVDDLALERARRAAFEAAVRRWHWEHPLERGALLDAVSGALAGSAA